MALLWLSVATAFAAVPSDALLERLKPEGFVNDFANALNAAQHEALVKRVRELQSKTGAELAVVIVKSLEGGQIDDFTHKLFNRWGVGQKGKNNGVMLLVALDDRKMRIDVGYGMEPILPDLLTGRIIAEDLRPLFQKNRYPDLKAIANFRDLQVQLEGTENRITIERQRYNDALRAYNTALRQFPGSIIGSRRGFQPNTAYFESAPAAKAAPVVDFYTSGK